MNVELFLKFFEDRFILSTLLKESLIVYYAEFYGIQNINFFLRLKGKFKISF